MLSVCMNLNNRTFFGAKMGDFGVGCVGFKEFLFHMRANDYYYVSAKLARRTDSFEYPLEILGAAISLIGRW